MTDRDALLAAIRASPDDDTPRLVYADYLEESGHPEHAAFIRLQIELEPVRHRLDDPHVRDLIRRLDHFRPGWDQAEYETDPAVFWAVGLRRGLPDWAETDVRTLLDRGEDYRAEYPTVRELAVFDPHREAATLAGCPALAGLDVVELACRISRDDAYRLAGCPHLAAVGTLRLWIGWSDPLAEAVAVARPQPARVELVQLIGGLAAGDRAAEVDAEADALARRVNAFAGRELAHFVRPFDRAFPLCGNQPGGDANDLQPGIDVGGGMSAGRLPNGTPALVGLTGDRNWASVAQFDADGWLVGGGARGFPAPLPPPPPARRSGLRGLLSGLILRPPTPAEPPPAPTPPETGARHRLVAELGLRPALIHVREFDEVPELRVGLWPASSRTYDGQHWTVNEMDLYEWLKGECFDVGGYRADWRGRLGRTTFED